MSKIYKNVICTLTLDKDKILLGKRLYKSYIGMYQTPGGSIETGESWYEAAIRETKEETGLDVNPYLYLGSSVIIKSQKNYTFHFCCANIIGDNIIRVPENEKYKCDDWSWYSIYNPPKDCTEPTNIALDLLTRYKFVEQ